MAPHFHLRCLGEPSLSDGSGLPIRFLAAMHHLADAPVLATIDAPVLRLHRRMLPPWLQRQAPPAPLPAARPSPLGVPRPVPFASSVPTEGDSRGSNRD